MSLSFFLLPFVLTLSLPLVTKSAMLPNNLVVQHGFRAWKRAKNSNWLYGFIWHLHTRSNSSGREIRLSSPGIYNHATVRLQSMWTMLETDDSRQLILLRRHTCPSLLRDELSNTCFVKSWGVKNCVQQRRAGHPLLASTHPTLPLRIPTSYV